MAKEIIPLTFFYNNITYKGILNGIPLSYKVFQTKDTTRLLV